MSGRVGDSNALGFLCALLGHIWAKAVFMGRLSRACGRCRKIEVMIDGKWGPLPLEPGEVSKP